MGAGKRLGLDVSAGNIVLPAFAQTNWTIIHNDLKATAESAGVVLQPGTYSNSNVFPIRVHPNANRILTRVRYATAISAVATQAQVAMFGAYGDDEYFNESTGVFNDTGSIRWARLDTAASNAATGTQHTITPSTDIRDSVWKYGTIMGEQTGSSYQLGCGWDLRGCKWVLALTTQAASVTGAGSVQLEAAFLSHVPFTSAPFA